MQKNGQMDRQTSGLTVSRLERQGAHKNKMTKISDNDSF